MDGRRVDRAAAERLGRNVFKARRRAGFSQEELGAMACFHRTEIGIVESGTRLPRVDTLVKLASALGVRVRSYSPASNGSCPPRLDRAASR
jgi:transcriptional regulator with XRE-family HTH domain